MFRIRVLLVGVFLAMFANVAKAAWLQDGTPVCNVGGMQHQPSIVEDGVGGAIISWTDRRYGLATIQVYAQRIDGSGNTLWTAGGVELTPSSVTTELRGVSSDGAGGAYILRLQTNNGYSAYIQRITSAGEFAIEWPSIGILLATGPEVMPTDVKSDGNGGAFVSWHTSTNENSEVFVQHVTPSGVIASGWPSTGLPITALAGKQNRPFLAPDGIGGTYVVWEDWRNGHSNLYAQRVSANGNPYWAANGIPIYIATSGQYGGYLTVSGGHLYVAWNDYRDDGFGDVYLQRITSAGAIANGWPVDGLPLAIQPQGQYLGWPSGIIPDGLGGVLVAWEELNASPDFHYPDVYLQRIQANGSRVTGWPVDGIPVAVASNCGQHVPQLVSDKNGGAVVVWAEGCNVGVSDIFAQHVLGNGLIAPGWPGVGKPICTVTNVQQEQVVAVTGPDHFIVAWSDAREDISYTNFVKDIYAQRVRISDGYIADPTPRPVVLVHGYCSDGSMWNDLVPYLTEQGFQAYTIDLNPANERPTELAARLAKLMDGPLAGREVDVIAHSMGGLVTRQYIRQRKDQCRIKTLITMGTPHHGVDLLSRAFRHRTLYQWLAKVPVQSLQCLLTGNAAADLATGSDFLNNLNYETTNQVDKRLASSRGVHPGESTYGVGVNTWTLAGTQPFSGSAYTITQSAWGFTYLNDGVVGVDAALLWNNLNRARRDSDMSLPPLQHFPPVALYGGSRAFQNAPDLFPILANILRGVPPPSQPNMLARSTQEASTDSVLTILLSEDGTIPATQVTEKSFSLPTTPYAQIMFGADNALFRIRKPDGTLLTPDDTLTVAGLHYAEDQSLGFGIYGLDNPTPGTWSAVFDVTTASSAQEYALSVEAVGTKEVSIETPIGLVYAPGVTSVRASLNDLGVPMQGVTWTTTVIRPDSTTFSFNLYDDGAHQDSLANDGIYGSVLNLSGQAGFYQINTTGIPPADSVTYNGTTLVELASYHDLAIIGDMRFSKNPVAAGDSVVIGAMIKNLGVDTADSLKIEFLDGQTIFATTWVTNLAPGASQLTSATWHSTAPDTHTVRVQINPFSVVDEANYANNGVSKTLVLGRGISAVGTDEVARPHLQLGPISPNPFNPMTTINFSLSTAGSATLRVYNVSGRLIWSWQWQKLQAGPNFVRWDGKSQHGQSVASGVYFFRLEANRQTRTAKAVLLK